MRTHHLAEDLVDGSTLLEGAFLDHVCSLLLHEEHEGIQRLLDVRFLLLHMLSQHSTRVGLDYGIRGCSAAQGSKLYQQQSL